MSSFIRSRGAAAATDPGTRPGLFGQTLISTGLGDLDTLLGGGLTLGAVLLVLEDPYSSHHTTLLKYFVAEGVACDQAVHLAVPALPPGGAAKWLPRLLQPGSRQHAEAALGKEAGQEQEGQLRIAWQYRRYIKHKQQQYAEAPASTTARAPQTGGQERRAGGGKASAGAVKDWCHHYDLTQPMGDAALQSSRLECCGYQAGAAGQTLASGVAEFVQSLPAAPGNSSRPDVAVPGSRGDCSSSLQQGNVQDSRPTAQRVVGGSRAALAVGRVAVQSLGSPAWGPAGAAVAPQQLLRLVQRLKGSIRHRRCAAMLTVPAGMFPRCDMLRLQHMCDAVLAFQQVADDSDIVRLVRDPASCCSLLHLQKLPGLGALLAPVPEVALYVVRNKRRRLGIEPLALDPDAEAAAAAAAGQSAASMLCGGPPAAEKAFDF